MLGLLKILYNYYSNYCCSFVWLLFILISSGANAAELVASTLTVNTAIKLAVSDNPNLAEMKLRYQALLEVPEQVSALPDPMINLNIMNLPVDTFDIGQEAMTQMQVGFSQVLPFPGKRSLKKEAAIFDAEAARYSVEEIRIKLIKDIKFIWWKIYYLDKALEILNRNQTLLAQLVLVVTTKYETGKGLQQDVLLAQLEQSKLLDQKIQLHALRDNQHIQLNILMGKAVKKTIKLPSQVSTVLPQLLSEEILYKKAEQLRPRLKQIETQVLAAKKRFDLARQDIYPDFKLGLNYGRRSGNNPMPRGGARSDFASVMLGIKIPLYARQKQSKAKAQKSLELQQNRYQLIDEKALIMAEISSAIIDYRQAKQQLSLFGSGIIPQAQQTVASMLAGYQVNEIDFLNLVRSQMTLFNYQLQYWKVLSNARQVLARLEAAVGEEFIYE